MEYQRKKRQRKPSKDTKINKGRRKNINSSESGTRQPQHRFKCDLTNEEQRIKDNQPLSNNPVEIKQGNSGQIEDVHTRPKTGDQSRPDNYQRVPSKN